jgi:hypothetical protein
MLLEIARRNRIRRVVSELNRIRHIQSRKIDILCNDIITSQKKFLNHLQIMGIHINLFESILGENCLEHVLDAAGEAIPMLAGDASAAIWLGNSFETHVFDDQEFTSEQADLIESCLNAEFANKIYKSRRCIELEELFEMGLPESDVLRKLSAVVIPMQNVCRQGFILLYRNAGRPITQQEISNVSAVVPGLSRAIKACQKIPQTAEKS